jgi:hypothetical protein
MNKLVVGFGKAPILNNLPERYLLIDDGELIDELDLPPRRHISFFDPKRHSFNPLKDVTYLKARQFINVLDAVFPEGETTLTKRYSNFVLLKALLSKPKSLDTLVPPSKENADAYQKIQTLLLSPVLYNVLNGSTNMSFKGTIIARLNRAELGDFDCFVLANLLISRFEGTVVVPDFGFYAHPGHRMLIRQNRLVAGINSFAEVPALKNDLVMIDNKIGARCTAEDAETLALYCSGYARGTDGFSTYVERCIQPS